MEHHAAAVAALREAIKPRLLNSVRGDDGKTLVGMIDWLVGWLVGCHCNA